MWLWWVILLRAHSPRRKLCWDWSLGQGTSCPGVPGASPEGGQTGLGVHVRAKCWLGSLELSPPGAKLPPRVRRDWQ